MEPFESIDDFLEHWEMQTGSSIEMHNLDFRAEKELFEEPINLN